MEGGDLRVTGDRVSLKTLHGLMPVDLIVRCIAGALADPLELDASGFAGPVGLLQAVRRHPDFVVNALGSALAENRGLERLPAEARRDRAGRGAARLPTGPAGGSAMPPTADHVLANIEQMVIRPAHEGTARPGRAIPGIDPARLEPAELDTLLQEIEIRGASLVAEAKVGFGTTPSLTPAGLMPKPYALRLFVTSTSNGFAVLPGGLAMTVDPDQTVALSAPDGESRDVWVVSDAAPPPFTSLWRPTIEAARVERAPQDLPSRAADNLFWLGRYTERADWTMRVLRICLSRLQEDSAPRQDLRACRTALEILLVEGGGQGARPAGADRRPPDRAAGAQPHDLDGLVLRPAAHARQHPPRRQHHARPPVARGVAHAQRFLRQPALARRRHADRRWATRCACSTTACACWRRSMASRTRT